MAQVLSGQNTADSLGQRGDKVLPAAYTAVPSEEKDDSTKSATVRANWWRRIMLDSWAPEIIAITFSTACIVAIAAVLKFYEGKSTPRLPYGITLNAVISILATASRSLLIFTVAAAIGQSKWCWYRRERGVNDIQSFDEASRGPWGSVMLLFSRRAQSLAAMGAAITVLALAFDPFVQQILTYPTKMVLVPAAYSSVTRTPTYVAFDPGDDEWLNAISSGVWSGSTQLMRQPNCATGTCTWPEPVKSVGWCSRCVDAMPYAKLLQCDWVEVGGAPTNETINSPNGTKCIVDFGHGTTKLQMLEPGLYMTENTVPNPTITRHSVWNLGGPQLTPTPPVNETFLNITNPVLKLGRVSLELTDRYHIVQIAAAEECVLTLCERAFNVSVVNATANFELLQTDYGTMIWLETTGFYLTNLTTWTPWNNSDSCWQPREAAYHVINHTNSDFDIVGMCNYASAKTPYFCPSGLNWGCGDMHGDGFAITLADRLVGSITQQFLSLFAGGYNVDVTTWITTQNLSTVLDSVAASLTQLGLSANTTDQVPGLAYQREVHVSVAWVWLSLPIALTLGSILLLIAAAVQSKRHKVKLWKSSVLPLLYHGFEDGKLGSKVVPADVSGMAEVAGGEKMQMVGSSMRRRTDSSRQ
ncbi:hypothetical protein LTR17_005603 [Elasticomyces elasticus]|nr:hypothetical protein LTR17_005603 [Elasticomyces elasticus]